MTENAGHLFAKEHATVEQARQLGRLGRISMVDYLGLLQQYENLLKKSEKLVRIGDSSQNKLMKMQRELQQATQAKSDFIASMSHEVRTPVNGILGLSGLLLDGTLDERQREYMSDISACGEIILALINDALDLAKIEAGRLEIDVISFDLLQLIGAVLRLMAPKAMTGGLQLGVDIAPDVPHCVKGDPVRIRQILLNLLSNAVKFTAEGQVVVRVRVKHRTEEGVLLCFTVEDSGIGIPADRQGQVFEPFVQAEKSTTRRFGGTGLGLSISRRLAVMMGGGMGLESRQGEGSSFWFTVLVADEVAQHIAVADPLRHACVLVDFPDNAVVSQLLCNTLVQRGLKVLPLSVALQNGAEDSPKSHYVLLTSVRSPEQAAAHYAAIRAKHKKWPLLFVVPYGCVGVENVLKEDSCADVIYRPMMPHRLLEKLNQLAERRGAAARAGARKAAEMELPPQLHRILLAEDNLVNRKVLLNRLSGTGVVVDVAVDGLDVLEKLHLSDGSDEADLKNGYDIILMDVQMPQLNGLDAARIIRDAENQGCHFGPYYPIPIIAMTAHAAQKDQDLCYSSGMNAFISKPLRMEVLFRLLREVFKGLPKDELM